MQSTEKDPLIGSRIREYEILELIGEGGMGRVYRARHTILDEERAIKVIQSDIAGENKFVDRFIREAKILVKLRHPNLIQLHDFGNLSANSFFMVLEFVNGESVQERIRKLTRIPWKDSLKIVRDAALGLDSAHNKGIVHRDISPDNLMIVKDDFGKESVKVLDFGIAKPLLEHTKVYTQKDMFLGKPEYCSPEQCGLLQEGEEIDRRTDVYSLAITLYHMIAGQPPFIARSPQGYLVKHLQEIPKTLSSHFPAGEIPRALDELIAHSLAKKREARPSTMQEFVRELDAVLGEKPRAAAWPGKEGLDGDLKQGDYFADRYLIEEKIGAGDSGTVYKTIDKMLEIPVALKILPADESNPKSHLVRLKRSVILARKVSHPNACRIYDMGEFNGKRYVSMEYVPGHSLEKMLHSQGRMKQDVGLFILNQVLLALAEIHRLGIIHRDLKPQNIMVDEQLRVWIMDFGISTSSDSQRVTRTGSFLGTAQYIAPELCLAKASPKDVRADLFSVGVIMYEMFVGRLPFQGDSPFAVINAMLTEDPQRPSKIVPDISPVLESIILKAMAKDVEARYQTANELIQAIAPLMKSSDAPVAAGSREQIVHKMIAETRYSDAIKTLNDMLKTEPQNEGWKKLLGHAKAEKIRKDLHRAKMLIKNRKLTQAQLILDMLHGLEPDKETVRKQIEKLEKYILHLQEDSKKSEENLAADREQFMTLFQSGKEAFDCGRWQGAIDHWEQALKLSPSDANLRKWVELAGEKIQSEKQERFEAVRQALSQKIKTAKQKFESGDYPEALETLQASALEGLQASVKETDPIPEVSDLMQEAQAISRRIIKVLSDQGAALLLTGKSDKAAVLFRLAYRYDPQSSFLKENLARAEQKQHQLLQTQDELRRAIDDAGKETRERGWLKAVSVCNRYLERDYSGLFVKPELEKLAKLRNHAIESGVEEGLEIAERYRKAGRMDKAREKYDEVLALDPRNATAQEGQRSAAGITSDTPRK